MISSRLLSAGLLLLVAAGMNSAAAITAELAKKCQTLTAAAFPPRVVGNPAAGSAKGSGKDMQAFFNTCIKNDGNMDDKKR